MKDKMKTLRKIVRSNKYLLRLAEGLVSVICFIKIKLIFYFRIALNHGRALVFMVKPHRQKTDISFLRCITDIEKNPYCSGCTACAASCPKCAVSMEENEEGFLVPFVNRNICDNCGLCKHVCPIINMKSRRVVVPVKCYVAQASDEIREKSSSGGMFSVLAETIIKQGGFVCGAAWSDDYRSVHHVLIRSIEELPKLMLSKYVQSSLDDTFKSISELLGMGKLVLFVGTPCQVAGLKSFLGEYPEKLFTVDLICCGIPSRKVFRKFIDEDGAGESICGIRFRNKDKGWYSGTVKIKTSERCISQSTSTCVYSKAHFTGLTTNKLCSVCPFDTLNREGDVSLGDFWGIGGFWPSCDDGKGSSIVLINTIKGLELVSSVRKCLRLWRRVPISWQFVLGGGGNLNIIKPIRSKYRRQFFFELKTHTLGDAYSRCIRDAADCIIFNNAITSGNYGSMLTAYALQEILIDMGLFAKVLNHARVPVKWSEDSFARRFSQEYLNLTERCESENDFIKLNDKTDLFIIGSDQMWRTKYWKEKVDKVLLSFADSSKTRIACAISFGVDYFEGTEAEKAIFAREVKKYGLITTREDTGVAICKREFGVEASWILDPVFIISPRRWHELADKSHIDCSGKLVYYGWNNFDESINRLRECANRFNCSEIVNITNRNYLVEDWLAAIRSAKLVVSDSFHGICFAVIFERQFICINDLGQGRFNSLKRLLGIGKNIVNSISEASNVQSVVFDVDRTQQILASERSSSYDLLRKKLLSFNQGEGKKNTVQLAR